jgi:hypothetical protein
MLVLLDSQVQVAAKQIAALHASMELVIQIMFAIASVTTLMDSGMDNSVIPVSKMQVAALLEQHAQHALLDSSLLVNAISSVMLLFLAVVMVFALQMVNALVTGLMLMDIGVVLAVMHVFHSTLDQAVKHVVMSRLHVLDMVNVVLMETAIVMLMLLMDISQLKLELLNNVVLVEQVMVEINV